MNLNSNTLEIDNSEWAYIGEGAAHIVFKYSGRKEELIGKALRIPKITIQYIDHEKESVNQEMIERMGKSAKFILQCVSITISNPSTILTNSTLPKSKSYDHIDIKSIQYYSTITESAFSFPFPLPNTNQSCYSFEIKPKWGSLPKNPMIEAEKTECRYCIQQYQKLVTGKFTTHSSYCPLKLFSQQYEDQIQAMQALFETGQNNLIFYIDGCRSTLSYVNQIQQLISEEEIKQYLSASLLSTSLSVNEMIFTDLLLNTLNTSHVLQDLLNVQNLSDMNDEMALEEYNNYLNQPTSIRKKCIDDYLMSRGARDCSILITILPITDLKDHYQSPCCFSFSIISFLSLFLIFS